MGEDHRGEVHRTYKRGSQIFSDQSGQFALTDVVHPCTSLLFLLGFAYEHRSLHRSGLSEPLPEPVDTKDRGGAPLEEHQGSGVERCRQWNNAVEPTRCTRVDVSKTGDQDTAWQFGNACPGFSLFRSGCGETESSIVCLFASGFG